ncbi:hypothetical protein KL928_005172 [Ogataea angusta]|uniref:Uncharacterized protein n=1 Tax=Pichia angusta TaxID=870730 RepID=A0AAN6I326_PICAN|nr:uncharacterized protein KL928_005172 [Ogataea angusta]KAG7815833.1 hypothetical protein KL928_005172 [Ogataea angusta]KAG7832498.1 hypothetical protein KL943_004835 [Ogataea angusta]
MHQKKRNLIFQHAHSNRTQQMRHSREPAHLHWGRQEGQSRGPPSVWVHPGGPARRGALGARQRRHSEPRGVDAPCCMCAGSAYWANIGQIVYGVAETRLLEVTGAAQENMTMSLSCREVIKSGQKPIQVVGPVAELEAEILDDHQGFWRSEQ